jgi:hypothetical protein
VPALSPGAKRAIESRIEEGAEASRLLSRMSSVCPTCGHGTNVVRDRMNQIIKEACDWFRQPGSSKDDHVAVRYVAALAEVHALEAVLGYRVDAAARARETLQGDQTAEA